MTWRIGQVVIVAVVLAVAGSAGARAAASGLFELSWSEPVPGVFVGNRAEALRSPVVANSIVVVGETGVLVFDGGGAPAQGHQVLAKVRAETTLPVVAVAISHWHGDHHRGNWPILDAFPDAQIVSHVFTCAAIADGPMARVAEDEKELGETYEAVAKVAETGVWFDGTPIGPEEQAFFARMVKDFEAYKSEFAALQVRMPTRVFDETLDIDLGGRIARLIHFGRGNTAGDIVLHLPADGFVATGDIVVGPVPYAFGSYPDDWRASISAIEALKPNVIVPGHGDIMKDTVYLDLVSEALASAQAQVSAAVAAGHDLAETRKAVDFSALAPRFTHGDPIADRFFKMYFAYPVVESAFNMASGKAAANEALDGRAEALCPAAGG